MIKKYKFIFALIWLLLIASILFILYRYQFKSESLKNNLGDKSYQILSKAFNLKINTKNIFVFIHSECPCTEASLDELSRLYTRLNDDHSSDLNSYFIFSMPEGFHQDIKKSQLWQKASKFKNSELYIDHGAILVKQLNINTSGYLLYFDSSVLKYCGGITQSRSHRGSNKGLNHLYKLLNQDSYKFYQFPTFGCALY